MVTFCWCGRPENSPRCVKEKHKEKGKPTKNRGVKFSGDSKHQQENNGFNGKRGR
jgi:hypothetical protein